MKILCKTCGEPVTVPMLSHYRQAHPKKFFEITSKGGRNGPPDKKGFANERVGSDGLTGKQRASLAGKKGKAKQMEHYVQANKV